MRDGEAKHLASTSVSEILKMLLTSFIGKKVTTHLNAVKHYLIKLTFGLNS